MLDQGVSQNYCKINNTIAINIEIDCTPLHYVPNFAWKAPCDKHLSFVTKNYLYIYRISFILASPSIKITLEKLRLIYVVNTTTVLQYNIFRKTPSVGIHTGMKIKSACYSIQLYNSPNIFYSQDRHFENTI